MDSQVGVGSCFWFELALPKPPPPGSNHRPGPSERPEDNHPAPAVQAHDYAKKVPSDSPQISPMGGREHFVSSLDMVKMASERPLSGDSGLRYDMSESVSAQRE